jgi:hypothetical protein
MPAMNEMMINMKTITDTAMKKRSGNIRGKFTE